LFLASIGICTGIYAKNFCDQRDLPTENIRIIIEVRLSEDFPEKYKEAVVKSANLCAIKKHLQKSPELEATTATQ